MPDHVAQNLAEVRERIANAVLAAHRQPHEVTLVAVSKTFPASAVLQAAAAGQRDFGENRVEEALPKMAEVGVCAHLRWHLIGHVQTRKAKDVVGTSTSAGGHFDLIHSVDSVRLAEALSRRAALQATAPQVNILLECNVSGEASKEGFALAGWEHDAPKLAAFSGAIENILALPHLHICGLMTMAPVVPVPEETRPVFASLRALRTALQERIPNHPRATWQHLSMGMSDDFAVAVAEGSTLVRVGRAIFGSRTH